MQVLSFERTNEEQHHGEIDGMFAVPQQPEEQ